MNKSIKEKIENFNEELIEIRKYFHQYPELGFKEYKTSQRIVNMLTKWGVEVKRVEETGVVGLLRGKTPGRTIALRADIDALPIEERTNVEFSSKHKGIMHACGHDGHITICLGAAKILSEIKDELKGNVKFIFQPAEEEAKGAKRLVGKGVLENPRVDAILGLHIWPEIEKGTVGIRKGSIMSAADKFNIKLIGKGGHGAIPNMTVDPIVGASQIVLALQTLVSREINPCDSLVISNCMFHGGDSFNIIPNEVILSGTTRYHNSKVGKNLSNRMEELISSIAKAMRCDYEFEYSYLFPITINDDNFVKFFENVAVKIVGQENVLYLDYPSMAAEDFSYYLNNVPGTLFFLGTKNEDNEYNKPLHHPEYIFDEKILSVGVELFCNTVVKFLNEGIA